MAGRIGGEGIGKTRKAFQFRQDAEGFEQVAWASTGRFHSNFNDGCFKVLCSVHAIQGTILSQQVMAEEISAGRNGRQRIVCIPEIQNNGWRMGELLRGNHPESGNGPGSHHAGHTGDHGILRADGDRKHKIHGTGPCRLGLLNQGQNVHQNEGVTILTKARRHRPYSRTTGIQSRDGTPSGEPKRRSSRKNGRCVNHLQMRMITQCSFMPDICDGKPQGGGLNDP